MAATAIESLLIRITGDISGYTKALNEAGRATERAGRSIANVGKKMTLGVTLPLAGLGVAALKTAADFDNSMREVNTLIGLSADEFAMLKKEVKGVSVELGLGLKDSASAAYQAISAGIPREEIEGFLRTAGKAAVAGVTDVETAVDGLTTILNAFKMEASQAEHVADIMFTGVKRGKTTMEELSKSMFQAAPLAASLGVSLEEVVAMTASLTKTGTPTSVAMTSIRQAMVALTKPNKDMAHLMERAGIASAEASIKTDGLVKTYEKLKKVAVGSQLTAAVGSVEALQAVLGTTGQNQGMFEEDLAAMQGAKGSMQTAFAEMDAGTNQGLAKFKASVEALADTIGNKLLPIFTPWAQHLQTLVANISEADPRLVQLGVVAGLAAAAIGPLLLVLGGAVTAVGAVAAVLSGPLILAIAAIAAGAALIVQNWEAVKSFFVNAIAIIQQEFEAWRARNAEVLAGIAQALATMKENAIRVWNALGVKLREMVVWIDGLLAPIGGLTGAWEVLRDTVRDALDFIARTAGRWFTMLGEQFGLLADLLEGNITIWEALKGVVGNVLKFLWDTLKDLFADILALWKTIDWLQLGKAIVDGIINGVKAGAVAAAKAVGDLANSLIQKAKSILDIFSPSKVFHEIGEMVGEGLARGVESKQQRVAAALGRLSTIIDKEEKRIEGVMARAANNTRLYNSTLDSFADRTADLLTGAGGQWESFGDVVKSVLQDLVREITRSGIRDALGTLTGGTGATGGSIWGGVLRGVGSLLGFADGGRPPVGRAVMVGERGPELFVADRPGTIVPNGGFGGGGGPTYQVHQHFESGIQKAELAAWANTIKAQTIEGLVELVQRGGATRRLLQA